MEKGKEFISPGVIYVPWTIKMNEDAIEGFTFNEPQIVWSTKLFQTISQKYDIIFIKEFIRRKKIKEKYAQQTVNKDFYTVTNISTTQNEEETIMNIDLAPKKAVESINFEMKILPTGGFFSI